MGIFKHRKKIQVKDDSFKEINLTKMAKRQLVITLFSIFGFTMLTIGSAYAVFTSVSKQENYNIVKVGTLEINFGEDANDVINLNGK